MAATTADATRVYLEVAKKRTFAMALDWPGWGRAGKTADDALAALAAYAPRYAVVAKAAGLDFPPDAGERLTVVEKLAGNSTTEYGAPSIAADEDTGPWPAPDAERAAALLRASWDILDEIVGRAPAELRKGPRGGGRDRDKIVDHVLGAEVAYAGKIGLKHRQPAADDGSAIEALRTEVLDLVGTPGDGRPPKANGWPVRYAARRFAWHVLDHAWEIEDRSDPRG